MSRSKSKIRTSSSARPPPIVGRVPTLATPSSGPSASPVTRAAKMPSIGVWSRFRFTFAVGKPSFFPRPKPRTTRIEIACLQRLADRGAAHTLPFEKYGRHLGHDESVAPAVRAQLGDGSRAIGAEAEVIADDDVPRAQVGDEQVVDERARRKRADGAELRAEKLV